ncbi:MAG TPA: NAD-dependent epimerase/dehydratase family protein [Elusimicrobiota bacterium]|nr:NAD-dependent epimerase/dehydratase family protein [Elusimicrobiota bacterium]
MKVFVTGGCGFLGSHVCEYYVQRGDAVVSYDNMTKHELNRTGYRTDDVRRHNADHLRGIGVELVTADVRNYEELVDHAHGCDYIIHTAAQPAMTISCEDPRLDMTTNVMGTFNVLEAARRLTVPVASCATVHVYGNAINDTLKEGDKRYLRGSPDIDENHPTLGGVLTPLHASKASADVYVKTYIDTYGLEAASFRLTGIYGPRQFGGEDHGWVAHFAISGVLGRPITLFGSGKQVRDIVYATDVCEAFHAFYVSRKAGVYNIGGGAPNALSLLECLDILRDIVGNQIRVDHAPDRLGDLRYFVCDVAKARAALGWSPRITPRQGIVRLVEWIQENKKLFVGAK